MVVQAVERSATTAKEPTTAFIDGTATCYGTAHLDERCRYRQLSAPNTSTNSGRRAR